MSSAGYELVREAFRTEERGIDWRSGVAGALAAVGPLAVGMVLDDPVAGFTAALGGLNIALCVPRSELRARLWWGSIAVLGGVGAVAAADVARVSDVALVVVSIAWVGAWAFFRGAGHSGALLGFAMSAVFVIVAGLPAPDPLGERLLWFAAGAVAGLALMAAARRGAKPVPVGPAALSAVRSALLHDARVRGYAIRLAVAVGLGSLFYRLVDLPHGYWVPLTTLAILQPSVRSTRVRSLQRTAGTLVAAGLIVVITLATDRSWPILACAAGAAFLLYALHERGYFWLVVLLTPTVLLMISAIDFEGDTVALDRIGNSTLGIVIGLMFGEIAGVARAHGRAPSRPA
jgi:hypothetical protein